MFNFFYHYPIDIDFNNRDTIPKTAYRVELQRKSQTPELQWLLERAETASEKEEGSGIYNFSEHNYYWKSEEELWVPSYVLFENFDEWCTKRKAKNQYMTLEDQSKTMEELSKRVGKLLDTKSSKGPREGKEQKRGYTLPAPDDVITKLEEMIPKNRPKGW
jgi:hypothetical protein